MLERIYTYEDWNEKVEDGDDRGNDVSQGVDGQEKGRKLANARGVLSAFGE
jgi:hypothetical protein